MADIVYRIPRHTDRENLRTALEIRDALKQLAGPSAHFRVMANMPNLGEFEVEPDEDSWNDTLKRAVSHEMPLHLSAHIQARFESDWRNIVIVERHFDRVADQLKCLWDEFFSPFKSKSPQLCNQLWIELQSRCRAGFKVGQAEAMLVGATDDEWSRYRNAQVTVLDSLSQTQQTMLTTFSARMIDAERQLNEAFEAKTQKLQAELSEQKTQIETEYRQKHEALERDRATLDARIKDLNTKESKYVARQKLDDQLKQLNSWITDWKLTEETSSKRTPVLVVGCVIAIAFFFMAADLGHLALGALLAPDAGKLVWWQWLLILLKPALPLLAFAGISLFLIRWMAAWARAHADEEFRNRARIVDIGRSGWLLEAVRDATEGGQKLPDELIRELSRNLFIPMNTGGIDEAGIHPMGEVLMKGLSSFKVKAPGGTEVEARSGS